MKRENSVELTYENGYAWGARDAEFNIPPMFQCKYYPIAGVVDCDGSLVPDYSLDYARGYMDGYDHAWEKNK